VLDEYKMRWGCTYGFYRAGKGLCSYALLVTVMFLPELGVLVPLGILVVVEVPEQPV